MSIDPKTPAQVTLNVFYDGGHHLAFGYNALMQRPIPAAFTYSRDLATRLGNARYHTSPATFSWHVDLGVGCPPSHPYHSLTYLGVANR